MICELCPRRCRAERTDEKGGGVCAMPALPVVARAALHFWEEPPSSGTRGSGTVFFSGCALGCVFCQNEAISHKKFGKTVTVARLREIFEELVEQGHIDGENLVWNGSGCLFTLTGSAEEGFQAEKWASGLGAYFFTDCTARRSADGTWTYQVGGHAIA